MSKKYNSKKIVLGLPSLGIGGLQNLILNGYSTMLKDLSPESEVVIVVADTEDAHRGSLFEKFRVLISDEIFTLDCLSLDKSNTNDIIRQILATREIDVIHNVNNRHLYPLYPELANRYRIIDQHFNAVGHTENFSKYKSFIDEVITDNKGVKSVLAEKYDYPNERISAVQTGIDLEEKFNPKTYSKTKLESIDPNLPVVSFVGRWSQEKGPDIFLEIINEIEKTAPKLANYILAGDGPMHAEIKQKIQDLGLGKTVLTPGLVDGATYLSQSDIVVSPSRIDGYPVSIMESLALGAIPVASAVGGIPELVQDGETGLVVGSGDIPKFADAIKQLVQNKTIREKMSRKGRDFAKENFSLEQMAKGYAQVLLK